MAGLNASDIAYITRIPRSTVREWLESPRQSRPPRGMDIDFGALPEPEYSYLLGLYLGDGTISRHQKGVFRLRITMDACYPGIIAECAEAMKAVLPSNKVFVQRLPYRAVEIGSYSKAWPRLIPQHGAGRKHQRKIELTPWQERIVECHPKQFLRGLIHSDGCRVLNRVNGKDYPRYFFSQVSDDIRRLFCRTCRQLGIEYTWNNWTNVSIARRNSVALLDSFVGPKL